MIRVEIVNINQPFRTWAIVDSGADYSHLPHEAALVLNLDPAGLAGPDLDMEGVGGEVKARFVSLKTKILRGEQVLYEMDLPYLVPVHRVRSSRAVLIGRHPFFSNFDVRFRMGFTNDEELGKWTLTEVTKRRDATRYRKSSPMPSRY